MPISPFAPRTLVDGRELVLEQTVLLQVQQGQRQLEIKVVLHARCEPVPVPARAGKGDLLGKLGADLIQTQDEIVTGLLDGLDGRALAVGLHLEDALGLKRVRHLVAREDHVRQREQLAARSARLHSDDARSEHVGQRVVLLVDRDCGRVRDLGVLLHGESARSARPCPATTYLGSPSESTKSSNRSGAFIAERKSTAKLSILLTRSQRGSERF